MRNQLRVNASIFFVSLCVSVIFAELLLRHIRPALYPNSHVGEGVTETPFLYSDSIGYETKPFASIEAVFKEKKEKFKEKLNSEGFRGFEYSIPKPRNTYRVLAIGDSVTEGFSVPHDYTWAYVLEELLNNHSRNINSEIKYEVINAGIGGYVSWQVLQRLKDRGLKYDPDVVLVLVGWNDLLFSSMPIWRPDLDLSKIEAAYAKEPGVEGKGSSFHRLKGFLYRYSYLARGIREMRNSIWNRRRVTSILDAMDNDSLTPFNQKALSEYLMNLDGLHSVTMKHKIQMALIVWPTLLGENNLNDLGVKKRMLTIRHFTSLSPRELWTWVQKYWAAQRRFGDENEDIALIDIAAAFASMDKRERGKLFVDQAHLTVEGNRLMADIIFRWLLEWNSLNVANSV